MIYQGRGNKLVSGRQVPRPAVDQFRRAAAYDPLSPPTFINLGTPSTDSGAPREAIAELERARRLDPNNPMIYLNWGNSLINLKRYEEALEPLRKSEEIAPSNSLVHLDLAAALANLQRPLEAVRELEGAAAMDPRNPTIYFNWAVVLSAAGETAQSIQKYQRVIEFGFAQHVGLLQLRRLPGAHRTHRSGHRDDPGGACGGPEQLDAQRDSGPTRTGASQTRIPRQRSHRRSVDRRVSHPGDDDRQWARWTLAFRYSPAGPGRCFARV